MNAFQKTQITVQIAAAVGLLVTLCFQYRQLRLMSVQVAQVRQSATARHILSLLGMMETEDTRLARLVVHTYLSRKPFNTWTEDEIRATSKICAAYANAGTVLKSGLVPPDPIIESWGFSLRATYEILEPFIRDMQQSGKVGRAYWGDLDWLYQEAVEAETREQAREAASGKRHHLMRHRNAGEQHAG
jgi:hypothetical protein